MSYLKIKTAEQITNDFEANKRASEEKRRKEEALEVENIIKQLEKNPYKEHRLNYALDDVLQEELKTAGFKVKVSKDDGPRGSGWTFTYISI